MKKIYIAVLFVFVYATSFASAYLNISLEIVSNQPLELVTNVADDIDKTTDKNAVIEQATKEVFKNYSNKIDSLKKYIRVESLMPYIDTYLKDETPIIELQIANKTFVQRYAKTESDWVDTDYAEVAAKLKVRTLDKIKQILIDVQESTPGLYIMTADKLRLLEKKVREEIAVDTP